jgi:hypothetical protein
MQTNNTDGDYSTVEQVTDGGFKRSGGPQPQTPKTTIPKTIFYLILGAMIPSIISYFIFRYLPPTISLPLFIWFLLYFCRTYPYLSLFLLSKLMGDWVYKHFPWVYN